MVLRHLGEVPFDGAAVVFPAVCAGAKRPIGHAADVELLVSGEEELTPHEGAFQTDDRGGGKVEFRFAKCI